MSRKKNKALERELLDDLLDEQVDDQKKPPPPREHLSEKKDGPAESPAPPRPLAKPGAALDTEKLAVATHQPAPAPTKTVQIGDDPTVRLQENGDSGSVPTNSARSMAEDEVRASVGRFGGFKNSTPTGAALAQSENLRIAQSRILDLEQELERLRIENEKLAAAGETFRRKADELSAKAEDLANRHQNAISTHAQEKALLLENKDTLRHDMDQLRVKNEELEIRISTNIQKIRVRERELENRLELVKMEGKALVRSKDEMILDLKRQIDQLGLELNNYRTKGQELNRMLLDKQDILRRTVKALRLALTMLEGEDDAAPNTQRKAK